MDGVLRRYPEPDAPLVLLDGPAQRRVIRAVNGPARRLGLHAGMSLTAAQALTRGFFTADYASDQIDAWHRLLAAWAYRFSSQVSLHYPRALLLEVESSLKLFGPWPRFEGRLRQELTDLGFRHRIVVAPNPVAARMLCNAHDGLAVDAGAPLRQALEALPIGRAGLDRTQATSLQRMGLRTLGQVLGLPRETLARRFTAELLAHLDRLAGQRALALDCYQPPDRFEMRLELNFDVESHQALLFPLRRLIADLAAFLAGRDCGVQRFNIFLEHVAQADTRIAVGLLSAEREPGALFELARGRLERIEVPAPVRSLKLQADELPRFVPQRLALFDDRPQQAVPWEQLHERLRARLGDTAVHGLSALADHRPERAWSPHTSRLDPAPAHPSRPGWLLAEPQPLCERPWRILAGPERVETGWWDGEDVRRDYFLIETRSGQRAWVFRRLGESDYHLHGWFA